MPEELGGRLLQGVQQILLTVQTARLHSMDRILKGQVLGKAQAAPTQTAARRQEEDRRPRTRGVATEVVNADVLAAQDVGEEGGRVRCLVRAGCRGEVGGEAFVAGTVLADDDGGLLLRFRRARRGRRGS
ncbi:hypothetical protein RM590_15550 [Streptomyces sp. DSM 44938]|uniref:Uncharacterized protein n=1 Tax=Streptomyces litchfieldiae TaxID=3075543 RepID=A0ABU2MRI1_9ACTN|nr:hypothetical protein [Streptomyces sp. DSM 44938]MDT0344022.1 hypothetical protein [Streptomyces sp. DSM 44938]